MTAAINTLLRASTVALTCALASNSALAGDLRHSIVRSVGVWPGTDSAINVDCAPRLDAEAEVKVLVVSFRVGKAQRWQAFNVPAKEDYTIGDEVVVDIAKCRVAQLPRP